MRKVYSKIDPDLALHMICRVDEIPKGKMTFLMNDDDALQAAAAAFLPKGHIFTGPHRHFKCEKITTNTQEAWIIHKGKVKVTMYDLNNEILEDTILNPGDFYVYLGGGHGFEVLTDDTIFFELKNGPYQGRDKDKENI